MYMAKIKRDRDSQQPGKVYYPPPAKEHEEYYKVPLQSFLVMFGAGVLGQAGLLRTTLHGHNFMALLHLKFYAWVDVATGEFLDPDRNDTAWGNDPRLLGVRIGRDDTAS
jgi:hypothetical protein